MNLKVDNEAKCFIMPLVATNRFHSHKIIFNPVFVTKLNCLQVYSLYKSAHGPLFFVFWASYCFCCSSMSRSYRFLSLRMSLVNISWLSCSTCWWLRFLLNFHNNWNIYLSREIQRVLWGIGTLSIANLWVLSCKYPNWDIFTICSTGTEVDLATEILTQIGSNN